MTVMGVRLSRRDIAGAVLAVPLLWIGVVATLSGLAGMQS